MKSLVPLLFHSSSRSPFTGSTGSASEDGKTVSRHAGVQYVPSTAARSGAARSMVRILANPLDRNNWRLIVGKGVRPACGDWVEIGVGRPGVGLESQPARGATRRSKTEAVI